MVSFVTVQARVISNGMCIDADNKLRKEEKERSKALKLCINTQRQSEVLSSL